MAGSNLLILSVDSYETCITTIRTELQSLLILRSLRDGVLDDGTPRSRRT